jgi:exosortase E/protease (VPEID-CTERM system)
VTAVARRLPVRALRARLAFLLAVLAAEGGLLAACFDAEPILAGSHAWWARLLSRAGAVMPLGVAVATATALFAGPRLASAVAEPVELAPRRRTWLVAAVHVAAFAATFALTGAVFAARAGGAGAALWLTAGIVTGLSAAELALPGRTYLVLGRRLAGVIAASAVVGVVAWGAGQVTGTWWHPLGRSTMWSVYRIVRIFSAEAIIFPDDFVVGTQSFPVIIAPECSGYQGIGLVWVFLTVYLWVFRARLRFPQALLLVPLATAVMWCTNVGRIAALVAVGTMLSREVAAGGFHANSGSLILCGVALGIGWAAHRSPFFSRPDAGPAGPDDARARTAAPNVTAAYLLPLLAILATGMATGIVAHDGFDPLYGLRVLTAGAALLAYRRELPAPRWRPAWEPLAVGAVVFVLWLAVEPAGGTSRLGDVLAALPAGLAAVWLVLRLLGGVVTVPLAEELAFRGYVARRLMTRDFEHLSPARVSTPAIAAAAVLFGAMHDRFVAGTLAGLAYGLLLRRRGALGDAVVAHATTNALLAAWVLATRRWGLW